MSFHGAHHYGNQTSAAGLQQSQERQAPFLSISQEPNQRGQRRVGTIRLSELGWAWGQGEGEVISLFNGPAINHLNVAPYFTPLCLCSHYSLPWSTPSQPVSLGCMEWSFSGEDRIHKINKCVLAVSIEEKNKAGAGDSGVRRGMGGIPILKSQVGDTSATYNLKSSGHASTWRDNISS